MTTSVEPGRVGLVKGGEESRAYASGAIVGATSEERRASGRAPAARVATIVGDALTVATPCEAQPRSLARLASPSPRGRPARGA